MLNETISHESIIFVLFLSIILDINIFIAIHRTKDVPIIKFKLTYLTNNNVMTIMNINTSSSTRRAFG